MSQHRKGDPNYPNPYSSGGHKEPVHVTTAGQLFRVRDDAPDGKVWGKRLTYAQAHKLKEQIAGQRKSRNPIVENMAVPFPAPVMVAAPAPAPAPPPMIQVVSPPPVPAAPPAADLPEVPDAPAIDPSELEGLADMSADELEDLIGS